MMNGRVLRKGLCRDFYGQVIIEHLRSAASKMGGWRLQGR